MAHNTPPVNDRPNRDEDDTLIELSDALNEVLADLLAKAK